MRRLTFTHWIVASLVVVLSLLVRSPAGAEARIVTATGEYRMGDNDTRADAKRLALLDAKRLALEQVGTYIESLTEVKNFDLSKEDIRMYTAGIVEVKEQATRIVMEGESTVVRVDISAKIDPEVVTRQIAVLMESNSAKVELQKLRQERAQLMQEVEAKNRELLALKSQPEVQASVKERQELLKQIEVKDLNQQVDVALYGTRTPWNQNAEERRRPSHEGLVTARRLAEQALSLDPSNLETQNQLGMIKFHEDRYLAAVRALKGRLFPTLSKDMDKVYVEVKLSANDRATTIERYRVAQQREPDNPSAHYNLGLVLHASGDLKAALREYKTALTLDPNKATFYLSYGVALLEEEKDLEAAIAQFRTAVRLNPDDVRCRYNLSMTLAAKEDRAGALAEMRAAVRLQPDLASYQAKLGKFLIELGPGDDRIDEAIRAFRTAISLEPDYRDAHVGLAQAFIVKRDLDPAIMEYQTALRLKGPLFDSTEGSVHRNLASAYRMKGDLDREITELQAAVASNDGKVYDFENLGKALYCKGDVDGAITVYAETVDNLPENGLHRILLGIALAGKGKAEQAMAEFQSPSALTEFHDTLREPGEGFLVRWFDVFSPSRCSSKIVKTLQMFVEQATTITPDTNKNRETIGLIEALLHKHASSLK